MKSTLSLKEMNDLYQTLFELRQNVLEQGMKMYQAVSPSIRRSSFRFSALNLAFYLAIRCHDLRPLQEKLLLLGLSSLGRSEARTMANLDAVIASLGRICNKQEHELIAYPAPKWFFHGSRLLAHNSNLIFGSHPDASYTNIMVTMPPEAATDYKLVRNLLEAGMDMARINCAHDTRDMWQAMLHHIHKAEKETKKRCKIYMDLAGPKVRISQVLVPGDDDRVFTDDFFFLARGKISDYPADYTGNVIITCSIPQVFDHLQEGDSVVIDDGKLNCVVTRLMPQGAYLRVISTKAKGFRLKNKKSLNFPKTPLDITPLTKKDLTDLDFIIHHADAIGYSFVRSRADILLLQDELYKRMGNKARNMAIIAKIETRDSVHNLPEIIVQAASRNPFGVMIARGDLAVEAGYHRLAELQEEILWICEAAHIPVIWATQVLENLVKTGIPSRAEITDAAMSERAECVMLNKGPYIVKAVSSLADIVKRMEGHQYKKAPQLRTLHIASDALKAFDN